MVQVETFSYNVHLSRSLCTFILYDISREKFNIKYQNYQNQIHTLWKKKNENITSCSNNVSNIGNSNIASNKK